MDSEEATLHDLECLACGVALNALEGPEPGSEAPSIESPLRMSQCSCCLDSDTLSWPSVDIWSCFPLPCFSSPGVSLLPPSPPVSPVGQETNDQAGRKLVRDKAKRDQEMRCKQDTWYELLFSRREAAEDADDASRMEFFSNMDVDPPMQKSFVPQHSEQLPQELRVVEVAVRGYLHSIDTLLHRCPHFEKERPQQDKMDPKAVVEQAKIASRLQRKLSQWILLRLKVYNLGTMAQRASSDDRDVASLLASQDSSTGMACSSEASFIREWTASEADVAATPDREYAVGLDTYSSVLTEVVVPHSTTVVASSRDALNIRYRYKLIKSLIQIDQEIKKYMAALHTVSDLRCRCFAPTLESDTQHRTPGHSSASPNCS